MNKKPVLPLTCLRPNNLHNLGVVYGPFYDTVCENVIDDLEDFEIESIIVSDNLFYKAESIIYDKITDQMVDPTEEHHHTA